MFKLYIPKINEITKIINIIINAIYQASKPPLSFSSILGSFVLLLFEPLLVVSIIGNPAVNSSKDILIVKTL